MVWSISASNFTRAAAVAAAMSAWASVDAHATTIDFSWSGANGYSAVGSFTYDGSSAPALIVENGAGATKSVQSFSVSFFDPARTVLEAGSAVIAGVSSDRFFQLSFDTLSNVVSVIDADIGGPYIYFLSNLRTPTGSTVPAGTTGFNFFDRRTANSALDTAPSLTAVVRAVPEPSALTLIATALISLMVLRRRVG
jgi:hypothetical protein